MSDEALLLESLEVVRRRLPDHEPRIETSSGESHFSLPCADTAECRFFVYVYASGEPQISAEPRSRPSPYFWAYHFELPDFDSPHQQAKTFLAELDRLLVAGTKIVEQQSFLWLSYTCLLERDGAWSIFGTRPSLLAPRLLRHRQEYRSPPIVPAAT